MQIGFLDHWKTQLNIMWFGQTILMAMLVMSLPYWPLYIAQLGEFSPKEIRYYSAAIYVAPFVTATFSSPLWGRLGDRLGYKKMVIRACVGLFITQTLILLFANPWLILLFRFLQGVLAGFIVSTQAMALAITPKDHYGATMGKLQSATAVGNLAGPVLGGVIATYAGYHAIFSFSSGICALITILFFFTLKNTPKFSEKKSERLPLKLKTIFSFHNSVMPILIVIMLVQLARQVITPVFSLFVTEKLAGNDMTIGVLYAATGLMIFISAPKWGKYFDARLKQGLSIHYLIASLLLLSAFLQGILAYTNTITGVFIIRSLWGICLGGLLPMLLRLLVGPLNNHSHGLLLGFGNSATKLGNLFGIIIGAAIEAHFGYTITFLLTAVLYIASAGIFLITEITNPQFRWEAEP